MFDDEETEYLTLDETQRQLAAEQIVIEEAEAEAKGNYKKDNNEPSERKILKRELQAQALKRLEDAARTVDDFEKVAAWWDRLDDNRERRERYHEILRNDEDFPLEYGASGDARCFPDTLNGMLEKQNRKGDFLDAIFCCPYEIHELVADEYISNIFLQLNDEQKFLLFLFAIRQYSSAKIAKIKKQSDRNIRKVRATIMKKIQKKLLSALEEKVRKQQPLTINEKIFLKENGVNLDNGDKK